MNRRIASILSIVLLLSLLFGFRDKGASGGSTFRYDVLERLPVYYEGREQPLSSVASSSLARIHKQKTLANEKVGLLTPIEWFCLALFGQTERSESLPVFKIPNDYIRSFILHRREVDQHVNWKKLLLGDSKDAKLYSFEELSLQLPRIETRTKQARETPIEYRTRFQHSLIELAQLIELYRGISRSAKLDESPYVDEIEWIEARMPAGQSALKARHAGDSYDRESFNQMMGKWYAYDSLKQEATLSLIPRPASDGDTEWRTFASVIDEIAAQGRANDFFRNYAILADAYRRDDPVAFNQAALTLETLFEKELPDSFARASFEHEFESWRLPRSAMAIFLVSLVGVLLYWMRGKPEILVFSYWISAGGFLALTTELTCRSIVAESAPIFGLYATSILLAWSSTLMGLALQRKYWNGLSLFAANAVASAFLAVALLKAKQGSSIPLLPVDFVSNTFTLGHSSMLTLGYASAILAGTIGILYFASALFTKRMNHQIENRFGTISYRLISISTGFLVAGSLLGGLWAQEAFGRFWSWSPKENSILLIILWNSIMLHAHWGGFTKPSSFLAMAIFGNLLCGFSLLGVDLLTFDSRSYEHGLGSPFAFIWFSAMNLAGLFLAAIPRTRWRSDFNLAGED